MTTNPSTAITQRPAATGDRLLSAALEAFSTVGFEGTSARQIERLAGVERGLVGYHFGTKQALWEKAVDMLFDRYTDELVSLRSALRDVSKRERTSAMLMAYARFNARNPEFFRILVIEGHTKSERSVRLALHLRRAMTVFSDITEMSGPMATETAIRWFQVIGAAGAMYSLSVHAEQTFGVALYEPKIIDQFATELTNIALNRIGQTDGESAENSGFVTFLGNVNEADHDRPSS